jgi:hypothetical protein
MRRKDHEFSVRPPSEFSSAFRSFSSHERRADNPRHIGCAEYISSRLRFEGPRNGGHFGLAAWRVWRCLSLLVWSLFFFYRRTREQNTRFDAAITRLQTGVLTQQQLMERSRRALEDGKRSLVFTAFQAVTPDSRAQILLLLSSSPSTSSRRSSSAESIFRQQSPYFDTSSPTPDGLAARLHRSGSNYFDRLHAEGLKRYLVTRLEGLGHSVTLQPRIA